MDSKNPVLGSVSFDGEEFIGYLVDLTPRELQGMLTTQEGFTAVCCEIFSRQAEWGVRAGMTAEDAQDLATTNARIARIDVFLEPARKFVELLTETRYFLDSRRQKIVLNTANSVDRRSKELPSLLALYEKTRQYRSAAAKKAVKTRRKNAARKAQQVKITSESAEVSADNRASDEPTP